ncbi:response regulator transcription factor [Hufsiella ginkgonis]|uniref:Response regulator n=1 Tax=Hufsiella ginkgonis TaxID=2695274 RepID=A0A7K1XYN8_9SPHI|nr:response regulator [Hufsiella ginkgonis]MXV16062.1 response regulator [Hufsiella ginkgonis]
MSSKLMIIEDDHDILSILSRIFEDEGYEVKISTNGDVEEVIRNYQPDLVLCDIWLPKKKGTELCRSLKADESTRTIPFILSSTSMNLPKLAHECGADSYIEKPFNIKEVLNIVKAYL